MKLPTEEDIYVCDCISSESLINPHSPRYKKFVMEEEEKLFVKWKKKMRRKKAKTIRKEKELKKQRELELKKDTSDVLKQLKSLEIDTDIHSKKLIIEEEGNSSKLITNDSKKSTPNKQELKMIFPQQKPAQIEFNYSKMKHQVSPEFKKYIKERVLEMVKNDSNISIDCGPRCLNRMICTECELKSCPVGMLCQNRRFQKQENKLVYPKKTELKGWGLFAKENIQKGEFIIQYLGEIFSLTSQIGMKRRNEYSGSTCTYLMKLSPKEVIDPTKKGNVARFINHSCDPNCVTRKWNVMGEVFVGIFAKKDIALNQELSFDYKFDVYKTPFLECFCKSYNCKGYLGLAGGNPNLRLNNTKGKRKLSPVKISINKKKKSNKDDLIELMSDKKSKKKSTFIIKKSQADTLSKGRLRHTRTKIDIGEESISEVEDEDDEDDSDYDGTGDNGKILRRSTKAKKKQLNRELEKEMYNDSQQETNYRLNEKDICEICKKSIYFDSDIDAEESGKNEDYEHKNNDSIPCTFCPANYHISCLDARICIKCGKDFVTEGVNQIELVAGGILKKSKRRNIKKLKEDQQDNYTSPKTNQNDNKSIDSDNLEWASQSNLEPSGKKNRKESFDSRIRKNSENFSIGFINSKSDFRTKKKQQFKMITDQIISIFDKDFPESDFRTKYFDPKNKLKPLCSPDSEPSSDFSNFFISPIELAVFKQRGTRIFLKQTKIHVFWNNSDISYKNFFARNSELRCGCRPEEKAFVSDLLRFIQRCVVVYRETSGTVENSFRIPAIFLKQVLGEYYKNSKFVEKEFGVKLGFDRVHVTDECYPIHYLTTVRLRGRSQNIRKAHDHIKAQLQPLVARRKYMTREDIKIIISKLQQIKRNINPTEIRCCRDNALRDINHPFYTIYYKDKEVAFIGTKERVSWAEKFVAQVIENNRRIDDNPLALNFLVPGGEKAELIHIKNKAEKKFPGNRMIIYDSLPPKRNSSLTLISTYRKFEDLIR
jgi:hypothetical protein